MWQLPLRLRLDERADFETFVAGENAEALALLQRFSEDAREPYIYLWGPPGSGKSHLLQAVCQRAHQLAQTPAYLPLRELVGLDPELLQSLEQLDLVCIDDLDAIAGRAEWEGALFALYNRLRDAGRRLLVSAGQPPAGLGVALKDLSSRLGWGPALRLRELHDPEKEGLLIEAAARRGMTLGPEAARYLLSHQPRDLRSLLAVIERLDGLSLATQRRLTIPFIRQHLG